VREKSGKYLEYWPAGLRGKAIRNKLILFLIFLLMAVSLANCRAQPAASPPAPPAFQVTYADVGQGDAIIVQAGIHNMLIDAGTNASTGTLLKDIKNLGINNFDVIVGTHPHEDHIGGMDAVISQFSVGTVYMPQVTSNTKTYEDVVQAIRQKGLSITALQPGTNFSLGSASCTVLAPNSSNYSDINNYSIVLRAVFGGTSFLFTGDAQVDSEKEMLARGYSLKSDVLKVGHHDSNTSTSPEFLRAVSPEYAVISVGKDNDYGHPHQVTLDKLNAARVKCSRTDLKGSITFTSDGANIKAMTEKQEN